MTDSANEEKLTPTPADADVLDELRRALAAVATDPLAEHRARSLELLEQSTSNSSKAVELYRETVAAVDGLGEKIARLGSFPLDKREAFAAFILMGLTSRLQPSQAQSHHDEPKTLMLDLAFDLADRALTRCK